MIVQLGLSHVTGNRWCTYAQGPQDGSSVPSFFPWPVTGGTVEWWLIASLPSAASQASRSLFTIHSNTNHSLTEVAKQPRRTGARQITQGFWPRHIQGQISIFFPSFWLHILHVTKTSHPEKVYNMTLFLGSPGLPEGDERTRVGWYFKAEMRHPWLIVLEQLLCLGLKETWMEGNITPPTHLHHSSFSTLVYFSAFFWVIEESWIQCASNTAANELRCEINTFFF